MHIVIINTIGNVESAKVFDTHTTSLRLNEFVSTGVPEGYIVVAACNDDCVTQMSHKGKIFFANMGSKSIWELGYKCGWAFIGISGGKDANENRAQKGNEKVYVTQIFQINRIT